MALLRATEALYADVQRKSVTAMLLARREWRTIDPNGDWFAQWSQRLPRLTALVFTAQVGAAGLGAKAVGTGLAEAGYAEPTMGTVIPAALAGWVSPSWTDEDGVLLDEYLLGAVAAARGATGSERDMLAHGGRVLEGLVSFAVADAASHAHDVQVTATRNTYSVFTEPGSMCQRCAPLVGKRYKPGTHVKRHPRCDGVMEAHSDRSPYVLEPATADRIKDLTKGQQAALDEGADLNQVLNAKRKGSVSGIYTTEGTTRRGYAYSAIRARHGAFAEAKKAGARYTSTTVGRLSPEAIYRVAKDQADMVRLLRTYGYIV